MQATIGRPCWCGTGIACDPHQAPAAPDFYFEIVEFPEPELGCTHLVTMREHYSGAVLESFTTDDPYGAVAAAREAQAIPLEERWAIDAAREQRERTGGGR